MSSGVNGTTSCTTNPAKIYMQFKCKEGIDRLNNKREEGLLVSCLACVACVVFLVVVYYQKKTNSLDFQSWDVATLTASDFTVEYTITEDMWNLFNVQLGTHT